METKYQEFVNVMTSLGYTPLAFEEWSAVYKEVVRKSKKKEKKNNG